MVVVMMVRVVRGAVLLFCRGADAGDCFVN